MITKKLTESIIRNPLLLQQAMNHSWEEDSGGLLIDPNNVLAYVLAMSAETTSAAVNEFLNTTEILYPTRARVSEDLYRHMSDYEYVGLYGSPAPCLLSIVLDKSYVMANAISFNDNYSKVVIPRSTVFTVGNYEFGLHYPIEIRVNKISRTISVVQNTTNTNPLQILSQNVLESRITHDGSMELLNIAVPVYQFTKTRFVDVIAATAGFNKKYSYNDRFYAVRVFSNVRNKEGVYAWQELPQALSNAIYDPESPTAIVTVHTETKQVQVEIPQVYLSEKQVRGNIRLEVYSTIGEMDYTIPVMEMDTPASMRFNLNEVTEEEEDDALFAQPLRQSPTMAILPIDTVVSGGSNGYEFEELRYNVIHDSFSETTPITPADVETFFKKKGYAVTKYQDGITQRIFLCHRQVTDGVSGAIISAGALNTYITPSLASRISSIKRHNKNLYTLLPSTIYEYNLKTDTCNPLEDVGLTRLSALSAEDRVREFNSRLLTISPFHVQLDMTNSVPLATAYDLTAPKVTINEFIGENITISTQLSLYAHGIEASKKGTAGYDLLLVVSRTEDIKHIKAIDAAGTPNIRVLVAADNVYQKHIWAEAEYVGRSDDKDVFKLHIDSEYQMLQIDGRHGIWTKETFKDASNETSHPIYLDPRFNIVLALRSAIIDVPSGITRVIQTQLPSGWGDYLPVSEQAMELNLGSAISALFNKVSIAFKPNEYLKHETTKFSTLKETKYLRDEFGNLQYEIENGKVVLTEEYPKGTLSMVAAGHQPSFLVENSTNVKEIEGEYIVQDVSKLQGLSTMQGKWSTTTSDGMFIIEAVDALDMVVASCPFVIGMVSLPKTAPLQTFIWVNDARIVDGSSVTIDEPINGFVVSTTGTPANGRLYMMTDIGWVAMIGGISITDVRNTIVQHHAEGEYHGYAYQCKEVSSDIPSAIAFLTRAPAITGNTPESDSYPLYPAFNSHTEAGDLITWENFINKWPWDEMIWLNVVPVSFTADNLTKTYYRLNIDSVVEFELVKAVAAPYCEYVTGQVILDGEKNPILNEEAQAEIVYLIQMLHLDAKLMAGTVASFDKYPESTRKVLRGYFNTTLDIAKNELMEKTKLFFEPLRSIGTGIYRKPDGQLIETTLDITLSLRVYVSQSAAEDAALLDLLKGTIIDIIDDQMIEGTVNCTNIAQALQERVPDVVQLVDVLGINGDPALQTLVFTEEHARPHLKHELVLLEDGTIDINRGLHLEVMIKQ